METMKGVINHSMICQSVFGGEMNGKGIFSWGVIGWGVLDWDVIVSERTVRA